MRRFDAQILAVVGAGAQVVRDALLVAFLAIVLAAPATAAADRISLNDLEQFGRTLVPIIEVRQHQAFASLLDVHSMAVRGAHAIAEGEYQRAHYLSEFVEGLGAAGITRDFFDSVDADMSVKFVRVTERGNDRRPLLRFENEDGYEYIEFLVRRSAAGKDWIVDWKSLGSGMMNSELMGLLAERHVPPRLLARLTGVASLDPGTIERLKRIDQLRASKQYAAAYAAFGSVPAEIADSRFLLRQRRGLAEAMDDAAGVDRIMARMKVLHADDPHAATDLLNHALNQGDLATSLHMIDTMESYLGGDAFTSLLREKAYSIAGMHEEAIASARQAILREPDYVTGYFRLGMAFLDSDQFGAAIQVFELLRRELGWKFSREYFAGMEDYAEFLASPEFDAWLPEPRTEEDEAVPAPAPGAVPNYRPEQTIALWSRSAAADAPAGRSAFP